MEINKEIVKNSIIEAYRQMIADRYNYEVIAQHYALPPSMTALKFEMIRSYFLTHIYPPLSKRQELNKAFSQLELYIKHPEKLMRLVMDSAGIVFKYGRHLPGILSAGLSALNTFRTATRFEESIASEAIANGKLPPFVTTDLHAFINKLKRSDIDRFMSDSRQLFEVLKDRPKVRRIVDILNTIITKMKNRPATYSEIEINALGIGLSLIAEADNIFGSLDITEQNTLFDFVLRIEQDALEAMMGA